LMCDGYLTTFLLSSVSKLVARVRASSNSIPVNFACENQAAVRPRYCLAMSGQRLFVPCTPRPVNTRKGATFMLEDDDPTAVTAPTPRMASRVHNHSKSSRQLSSSSDE